MPNEPSSQFHLLISLMSKIINFLRFNENDAAQSMAKNSAAHQCCETCW